MGRFVLEEAACRARQQRLLAEMETLQADVAIVTRRENVQWLTGVLFGPVFSPAVVLWKDGSCLLVAPASSMPDQAAADEIRTYEGQSHSTLRNDQPEKCAAVVLDSLQGTNHGKVAVEWGCCGPYYTSTFSDSLVDIEPTLFRLRRRRDPDELVLQKKAIGATGAMYDKVREILKPGLNELEMFNALQATAVEYLSEMITGTGNDYASGEKGGPPRDRKIEAGELYILDLGPAYRGYFADNCRAFAVNREPTEAQQGAWDRLSKIFPMVEAKVKPGVSCKGFFEEIQAYLDEYREGVFDHHLGHGVGLFPHEAPHLNPNWDDVFEVGDVFTVEPGLYWDELRFGIRLENDYLVTEQGVELLSDFPLGLT
ncbi:Xaa-Pro dipeptidase [Planctomycetales bacterium 10988]|nr:Xaa-Pro dipeptidase [Planctomycetales bacterium 10988]